MICHIDYLFEKEIGNFDFDSDLKSKIDFYKKEVDFLLNEKDKDGYFKYQFIFWQESIKKTCYLSAIIYKQWVTNQFSYTNKLAHQVNLCYALAKIIHNMKTHNRQFFKVSLAKVN